MTRIDFYILPETAARERLVFACRLAQRALQAGSQVYLAVDNAEQARELDQLMWDFRPESFLAHDCEGQTRLQAPVAIGFGDDCGNHHDLLINLKQQIPDYFSRFERLAEIVCQDDQILAKTREHFTFYRDRGYPIQSHNLKQSSSGA